MGVRGFRATLVCLLTVFQLFTLSHAPVSSSTDQELDRSSSQAFRILLAHPQTQGLPVLTWEKPARFGCGQQGSAAWVCPL